MHRYAATALILLGLSISCTVEEIKRPSSIIDCDMDFSDHPRDSLYQSIVDKYVAKGLVGLSVLVRDSEEGLWIGCAGYANIEDGVKMNPCHVHYASSITKSYTATMIMLLTEAGSIDLDATIDKYLPARITDKLPNGHKATVRNLLNHTSGILDFTASYLVDALNDYKYAYTPEEQIAYIYTTDPLWEPGGGFSYSNTNYTLLALIADGITGDHAEFLQERILDPLELDNTYYKNHPDYPQPPGLVNSYSEFYANGKLSNFSDVQNILTSTYIGEAGLMAAPLDFSLFFEHLFRDEIVSSESLDEMTTWVSDVYPSIPASETGEDYGLGLHYQDTPYGYAVGHSGGLVGDMSDVFYFPEHDVTIVICTNSAGLTLMEIYQDELIPELFEAVFKEGAAAPFNTGGVASE
jgi:D-alanyl-D-alanine carboxypeptidase